MAKIRQLDPHVADLIAAGEVVERPSSVVKELVENALDAGATAITVEIQGGGLTYIRVTDNGSGMDETDAKLAFSRHATSKLRTGKDLEAIGTLGFRGEALAAISAVSRIDLLTREPEAEAGVSVTIEAGQVMSLTPAGCPQGTTIIVRDLFFNTPARLKFMKTDRAEGAAITAMLGNIALSKPHVSIRYIKDGKEEHHTPGDGSSQSAIYTLLGRDFAKGLVAVDGRGEDVEVKGFVTAPANVRGSRSHQRFYVNGRFVRSSLLQAALEQAYQNLIPGGKYPGSVLYITMRLGAVDVNVHPAKTEVKFLHERPIFDSVYYSVKSALEKSAFLPEITLTEGTRKALGPAAVPVPKAPDPALKAPSSVPKVPGPGLKAANQGELRDMGAVAYESRFTTKNKAPVGANSVRPPFPPEPLSPPEAPQTEPPPLMQESEASPPYRVIGEALGTYILVERGEELLFIDKHAAHERIIFDRLKNQNYSAMAQALLAPIAVDVGPEATAILMEHGASLERLGFSITQFGEGTVALRQVPGDIELDELESFLTEIAQGLSLGRGPDLGEARDKVLHTMACKAAIKAGRRSEAAELQNLAEQVLSGGVQYCPHGRPVTIVLTRGQLDKQVRRG